MNQKKLWIAVALFTTVVGMPSIGRSQTTQGKVVSSSPSLPSGDVVKVGEYQSPGASQTANDVIAKVHTHYVEGRQAATLFVRDIPVITFLGSEPVANGDTKMGVIGKSGTDLYASSVNNKSVKVAATENIGNISNQLLSTSNDPVSRAAVLAASLNQLNQGKVDASKITVSLKGDTHSSVSSESGVPESYVIKINDAELVEINKNTRLPDTTKDLGQDALQVTNRLRRLMGQASPLSAIENAPTTSSSLIPNDSDKVLIAQNTGRRRGVRGILRGIASFYGYDFSGSKTASGERFNPEGMTAAHRSLPFGTRVRVINPRNGRSVVVRINDRGPFIRGRVIDLSYGAARVLGIIGNGIAPVKIQVIGR